LGNGGRMRESQKQDEKEGFRFYLQRKSCDRDPEKRDQGIAARDEPATRDRIGNVPRSESLQMTRRANSGQASAQ
jgi:hypothetical protein